MRISFPPRARARGNVLLVALCICVVVGLALLGYLQLSGNQTQLVARSQVWNACIATAEAGVEEALTHCSENYSNLRVEGWSLVGTNYAKTNQVGEGSYWVRISMTPPYEILSTGYYPMPGGSTVLSRTVRVTTGPHSVFNGAILIRNKVNLNGNNILTDSYDSRYPEKSTFGFYDSLKAGDRGDVACVDGVADAFKVGNADIWGHAYTGPNATLYVGPEGSVGSVAFHRAGNHGIESGWWVNQFTGPTFDPVQLPFTSAPGPDGATNYNGVSYNKVLRAGKYVVGTLSEKVLVTDKAVLVVNDKIDFKSSDMLTIAPGASLTVYVNGPATFNTIINNNSTAGSFVYYGTDKNTTLKIQGNAKLTAAIYAPDADLTLIGGVELFGSVVAKTAWLTGSSKIHYDEALMPVTPFPGIVPTSWMEL